jgi:hypothetical protein
MSYIPIDSGVPHRVKAICLPFIFVKHPGGSFRPLDVRVCQIARLNSTYAEIAWKSQKQRFKKRRPSNLPD